MRVEDSLPRELFHVFGVPIRDTVVVTWCIVGALSALAWVGTRRLEDRPGAVQNVLESVCELIERLVAQVTSFPPRLFVPFIGTLAVFLFVANSVSIVPWVGAPTRDLNTTLALAAIVFCSVHGYGLVLAGPARYLRTFVQPSWILLPFNIIGDLTRTLALAIRLFGNVLSGEIIAAILLLLAGLLVPVVMQLFGLLISWIQAWVFTLLAMVYIAAGLRDVEPSEPSEPSEPR